MLDATHFIVCLPAPQHVAAEPAHQPATVAQHAAGGGEAHGFDPLQPSWGLTFWSAVTFGLLIVLLTKFAWKPIVQMVEEREKRIRGDLDAADKARGDAESTLKKYQAELDAATVRARETVEAARVTAEKTAAGILAAAKVDAEATVVRARAQIEAEKDKALSDIRASVVELSIAITREVVKRTAREDDHAAAAADILKKVVA